MTPRYVTLNKLEPCEIQVCYQLATYRKPSTAGIMVTWPKRSRSQPANL